MKQFFKNHWKVILLILVIILGFVFYYEILPRYNLRVAQVGYDACINNLVNSKSVPLPITYENQTRIISVEICSEDFINQYQNLCGGQA